GFDPLVLGGVPPVGGNETRPSLGHGYILARGRDRCGTNGKVTARAGTGLPRVSTARSVSGLVRAMGTKPRAMLRLRVGEWVPLVSWPTRSPACRMGKPGRGTPPAS